MQVPGHVASQSTRQHHGWAPPALNTAAPSGTHSRHSHKASRQHCQTVRAIHIDRRQHLELAWKRQQERDEMLKQGAVSGKVMEIQDLQHLESVVDKAGSSLLCVFFYTRSCGVCKELLRDFTSLCEEAKSQKIRAVFARHNLIDDFDSWSDISVWNRIRVVPTIYFYDEGAVVKKITMHDVRRMGENYTSLRATMQQDLQKLKAVFRQTVFEKAPGARS